MLLKPFTLVGKVTSQTLRSGFSSYSKNQILSSQSKRFFSGHGASDSHHKAPVKTKEHEKNLNPDNIAPKKHNTDHLFPFEEGDYVPPTETHAVGDEKVELDFGPFEQTVLKGGFGTEKSPIEVPSRYHSRIVGCTGSADSEHEVLWHEVKHGKNTICMECGQFFKLEQLPGFEHLGHHHDDHHGDHDEPAFAGHTDGDGFRFMYPPKTKAQLAAIKAERDEELKKDPKAPVKKVKSVGVDYHDFGDEEDGRLSSKAPYFHDRREQVYKDRK